MREGNAELYRQRAQQLRDIAADLDNPKSRETLEQMARDYEKMARDADARARGRNSH